MRVKLPKHQQPHGHDPYQLHSILDVGVVLEPAGSSSRQPEVLVVAMSGRKADDECLVGWCAERIDHTGPHRRPLLDTLAMNVETGKPEALQLWLQGESARARALVLVTYAPETGLTWRQADDLATTIRAAQQRYAS